MNSKYWPILAALLLVFAVPVQAQEVDEAIVNHIVVLIPDREYREKLREDLERHWGSRAELRSFQGNIQKPDEVSLTLENLAQERQLSTVVVAEAPVGSLEGIVRLRTARPDLHVFVVEPDETLERIGQAASLTISLNQATRGFIYATMATRMGVKNLVYLSFPRHQALPSLGRQYRVLAAACRDLKLNLVAEFNGPDPWNVSEDFLNNYLGRLVDNYLSKYGRETAFMSTSADYNRIMAPMIAQKGGALLESSQPNLLYGGLPEALGLTEESREYFGSWRRLLTLEDEKYLETQPPGQFATWTYPYPHTAILAAVELGALLVDGRTDMDRQTDIYDLANITAALAKFSPGSKWQVIAHVDRNTDNILHQVIQVLEDTYWLGHGYQGFPRLNIPAVYHRIY